MPSSRRTDLLWLLGLAAAWSLFWAAVDPRGDYPLNDDFQYAESVRGLLRTGELRLSQWSQPAALPQIFLGAAAGMAAGEAPNGLLRLLNLALGLGGIAAFFLYMRSEGLSAPKAAAAASALAVNPVYLAMCGSFHTDVLPLGLLIGAAWAARRERFALSSVLIAVASLNRQIFLLALAPAAWAAGRRNVLRVSAPAAAIAAAFALWYWGIHGPTWAWRTRPGDWPSAAGWLSRLNGTAQTLGLWLLPVAAGGWRTAWNRGRPRAGEAWALSLLSLLALGGWALDGGLPLLENTWGRRGLGVVTLNSPEAKCAGLFAASWPWRLADLGALASTLCLVRLLFLRPPTAASWILLAPALASLALPAFFDRYLLPALAGLAACVWTIRAKDLRPTASAAPAVLLLAVSWAGLADYYAWNRARWESGLSAVRAGLPPEKVENGFDWNGQHTMARNMERLLAERPAERIGVWDWMALNRVAAATSFSPRPPSPFFSPAGWFEYKTPLCRAGQAVYLHRLATAGP